MIEVFGGALPILLAHVPFQEILSSLRSSADRFTPIDTLTYGFFIGIH